MRIPQSVGRPATLLFSLLLTLSPFAGAVDVIESDALSVCMAHSELVPYHFDVSLTPANQSISLSIGANSAIHGYVMIETQVIAYGYTALSLGPDDPCEEGTGSIFAGLCPMNNPGPLTLAGAPTISKKTISQIPSIAYGIPDLDGQVRVQFYNRIKHGPTATPTAGKQIACVQANLSNGKTVYQKGVGWASAVIAGMALVTSAVVSGLGHSNTATHIAANALSLFGFFQQQALFGMTAVPLPPIVASWTQNFQWSMGIISVGFIQDIASWYQQSTGGKASTLLANVGYTSVTVLKRSLEQPIKRSITWANNAASKNSLVPRSNSAGAGIGGTDYAKSVTIRGIERVGYRAGIEITDVFMTGYIFFVVFVIFVVLAVIGFRWALEALVRSGKIKGDKFQDFRNGWTTVLRGILFRLILIGFPQMATLCFWELVHQDSAGEEALAVITIFTMLVMLVWACTKVWMLARRSISMHKNPAYILYSDPVCLHKWGFLYVQFKATTYWFIIPLLGVTFVRCLFVAFGQGSGIAQAVGILILEASTLIGISILRPYMDKKTNAFNISIASVNFVSSIFLLFFTGVFGLPGLVVGVMGVIFFFLNAIFALILLLMVLVATLYAIFSKNPDVRYQPMRDDRGSFIKSQTQLTTELDALGATARGEGKSPYKREFDSDSSSFEERHGYGALHAPYNKEGSQRSTNAYEGYDSQRTSTIRSQPSRSQTASPWQRGAGYDH